MINLYADPLLLIIGIKITQKAVLVVSFVFPSPIMLIAKFVFC